MYELVSLYFPFEKQNLMSSQIEKLVVDGERPPLQNRVRFKTLRSSSSSSPPSSTSPSILYSSLLFSLILNTTSHSYVLLLMHRLHFLSNGASMYMLEILLLKSVKQVAFHFGKILPAKFYMNFLVIFKKISHISVCFLFPLLPLLSRS